MPRKNLLLNIFFAGVLFGIIQTSFYFTILINVTATYFGYFILTLLWLAGTGISLNLRLSSNSLKWIGISLLSFYFFYFISQFVFNEVIKYIILATCIFISGFSVGVFFNEFGKKVTAKNLFFHENNGFILGSVLSLFLFLKFGIYFLYFIPVISFLILLSSFKGNYIPTIIFPIIIVLAGLFLEFQYFTICGIVILFYVYTLRAFSPKANNEKNLRTQQIIQIHFTKFQSKLLLIIAGFNLIVLQFYIVREFSSILSANEFSILIVSTAYFIGMSIGYYISEKLNWRIIKFVSITAFIIHLAIFTSSKFIAAMLITYGLGFIMMIALLFTTALLTSAYFSIFLPKIINLGKISSLSKSYFYELIGAITGSILIIISVIYNSSLIYSFYFLLMLLIITFLFESHKYFYSISLVGIFLIALFTIFGGVLTKSASEDFYQSLGYDNPEIIFSQNSFYHSVDVVKTNYNPSRTFTKGKYSFLNGINYFNERNDLDGNESSLSEFTYFLAELPAKYLAYKKNKKLEVLILGGGSLYSINRVAPYSKHTTLVEIDPVIVKSSKQHWSKYNKFDKISNYEIVIDDAKHFLRSTDKKYDLIIMDISAPYYLGTALLHNRDFYSLIKSKLAPNGLFSESTQGRPQPKNLNSSSIKILKGVEDVFNKYRVIDCKSKPRGKRGFVIASDDFEFKTDDIVKFLKADNKYRGTAIYYENSKHFSLSNVKPFSLSNMEILLDGNINRISRRISSGNKNSDNESYFITAIKSIYNYKLLLIFIALLFGAIVIDKKSIRTNGQS